MWQKEDADALKSVESAGQGWCARLGAESSASCSWERICSAAGLLVTLFLCVCFHFRSIHPFEIPEIISLPIDQGNPLYLKWIEESVPRD